MGVDYTGKEYVLHFEIREILQLKLKNVKSLELKRVIGSYLIKVSVSYNLSSSFKSDILFINMIFLFISTYNFKIYFLYRKYNHLLE